MLDPPSSKKTLAKLQQSMNAALNKVNDDQKEIYSGLNRYGKALDKVLIPTSFSQVANTRPSSDVQSGLYIFHQRL
jgi:hypothetical protein